MLYELGERRVELRGSEHYVAHNASVIGSVVLEHQASVWFNAVLRADNDPIHIGERSNVQDGAVLHTDPGFPLTIGRGVTIGHKAMLHGCTLGSRILIGMAAVIMDGAVVGDDVIIAAGTLVPPGKVLESGYLYKGSPVQRSRALTDEELKFFNYTSSRYVDLAAAYLVA